MAKRSKNDDKPTEPPARNTTTNPTLDKDVWKLVTRTADRNNVKPSTLVYLAIDAMVGSLATYGYDASKMSDGGRKATIGNADNPTAGSVSITLNKSQAKQLNAIGVYFGVRVCDLVRDSILGQRFNWQRLQPTNARTMPTLRLHMFELEQLGPR